MTRLEQRECDLPERSPRPGAVVGGCVLGIAESAANRWLGDLGLSGLRYVVVLVVLLVVMLGRQLLPELRARYEALRADQIARSRLEARREITNSVILLVICAALFAWHWRWVRRAERL